MIIGVCVWVAICTAIGALFGNYALDIPHPYIGAIIGHICGWLVVVGLADDAVDIIDIATD